MGWLWYDTALENRSEEYRERAETRMREFHDTYTKAKDVIELAEKIATHEGDPKETLEILEKGLSIASDYTGAVPLTSEYLTLLSHAADAAIAVIDVEKEALYDAYVARREAGLSHEAALPKPQFSEEFRLRYRLEKAKAKAQDMEVPVKACDVCGRERPVDKRYQCGSCDNRVCNHCLSDCNEDGDDGRYCKDCRIECTHCGLQYCDDHVTRCPVDGKPYCASYVDDCAAGGETQCLAHLVACEGCADRFCEECFNPYIEAWELAT